ncbi:hypothetical protein CJF31_00005815 [Rutstroemia sp. NJR-2017a BVV2]|nr:hypothetical protein CJF31_00005815 [Rutstroemia sp. NJR-2017a BVV2]
MSSDACLSKSTQGFPYFSKLPLEIQVMIWEEVCDFPNVILTVRHQMRRYSIFWTHDQYQTIPSVLHVCVEARRIALQKYDLIVSNSACADDWESKRPSTTLRTRLLTEANRKKFYINYAADIMACAEWDMVLDISPENGAGDIWSPKRDFSYCGGLQYMVVENLQLDFAWDHRLWLPTKVLLWFTRLQSIRVAYPRGPLTQADSTKLDDVKRAFEKASEKRIEDKPGSTTCELVLISPEEIAEFCKGPRNSRLFTERYRIQAADILERHYRE